MAGSRSPVLTTPLNSTASRWCSGRDRKSTRLNSSHSQISYAVFCLKKTDELAGDHVQVLRGQAQMLEDRVEEGFGKAAAECGEEDGDPDGGIGIGSDDQLAADVQCQARRDAGKHRPQRRAARGQRDREQGT